MNLEPLVLSVLPRRFLLSHRLPSDRQTIYGRFRDVEPDVVDHHKWTCRFCGYHEDGVIAKRLQCEEGDLDHRSQLFAIPLDGDYANLAAENLAVACVFCRAAWGMNLLEEPGKWAIAVIPGFDQFILSWLCRVSILADDLENDASADEQSDPDHVDDPVTSGIAGSFQSAISSLHAHIAERVLISRSIESFSDVALFIKNLEQMSLDDPEKYQDRERLLAGVRLVPQALINEQWQDFLRYTRFMREASSYGGIRGYRHVMMVAKQAFEAVHNAAFPKGDPIGLNIYIVPSAGPAQNQAIDE